METFNVKIPLTTQSFYTTVESKQNEDKIKNVIIPKYGKIIDNISKITNVPAQLIQSIIFIESRGNADAQSPYATGLMQLNGATASDVIVKEKGLGRLRDEEAAILKKYLVDRFNLVEKVKPKQTSLGKTFVTNDDLMKPEFNILVGSLLLGQLLNEFNESGKIRLDKLVVLYNGGRQTKAAKKIIPFKGNTDDMLAQVPKETANYIKKLVGKNGILEAIV